MCGIGNVAHHAGVVALELRHAGLGLLQRVEDGALLGILRHEFQHGPAADPSDRTVSLKKIARGLVGLIRGAWKLVLEKTRTCESIGTLERREH